MLRCSMNNKARESYPATTRPSSVSVPAGVIIFESRRGRDTPAVTGIRSLLQQRGTAARPAFQDIRRTKRDVSTKRRHWYPSSILLPFGVVDISSPTPGTWHFLFQTFSPFVSCISFSSSSSSFFIYLFIIPLIVELVFLPRIVRDGIVIVLLITRKNCRGWRW